MKHLLFPLSFLSLMTLLSADEVPQQGVLLDLDASKGVTCEDGDHVVQWSNQVTTSPAKEFVKRDEGRKVAGSGRPTWRKNIAALNGKSSLVFLQQELVCLEEDAFDSLITGSGHTWLALIAVHEQRVGLKDVNSFFGNLHNGEKYEGVWGCFNDDNTLWWGARNGVTFGRFDANNPQVLGPKWEKGSFHLVAGRMGAGQGVVKLELFCDSHKAMATADFPVNPKANSSRMTMGQERDAIQHPGHESFNGEIARFLIWDRPLGDDELQATMATLRACYFRKP